MLTVSLPASPVAFTVEPRFPVAHLTATQLGDYAESEAARMRALGLTPSFDIPLGNAAVEWSVWVELNGRPYLSSGVYQVDGKVTVTEPGKTYEHTITRAVPVETPAPGNGDG